MHLQAYWWWVEWFRLTSCGALIVMEAAQVGLGVCSPSVRQFSVIRLRVVFVLGLCIALGFYCKRCASELYWWLHVRSRTLYQRESFRNLEHAVGDGLAKFVSRLQYRRWLVRCSSLSWGRVCFLSSGYFPNFWRAWIAIAVHQKCVVDWDGLVAFVVSFGSLLFQLGRNQLFQRGTVNLVFFHASFSSITGPQPIVLSRWSECNRCIASSVSRRRCRQ